MTVIGVAQPASTALSLAYKKIVVPFTMSLQLFFKDALSQLYGDS